jgi:signal peptidase I
MKIDDEMRARIIPWLKWLRDIAVLAVVIFGARSAIADWNNVPTGSMKPTILEGDIIFVNRLAYDLKVPFTSIHLATWGAPKRGQIVIISSSLTGERLVKRVVGVPGDTVAMRNNVLFINDKALSYKPLDPRYAAALSERARASHRFETEKLGASNHPVMVMRGGSTESNFPPIQVPAGKYLVLGDNRDNSADSRYFGLVDRKLIMGHATAVIVSWNPNNHYLPRSGRFFKKLP